MQASVLGRRCCRVRKLGAEYHAGLCCEMGGFKVEDNAARGDHVATGAELGDRVNKGHPLHPPPRCRAPKPGPLRGATERASGGGAPSHTVGYGTGWAETGGEIVSRAVLRNGGGKARAAVPENATDPEEIGKIGHLSQVEGPIYEVSKHYLF